MWAHVRHNVQPIVALSALVLLASSMFLASFLNDVWLPAPRAASSTPASEFSEDRAVPFLRNLTVSIGTRPSATPALFHARQLIIDTINDIVARRSAPWAVTVDPPSSSGEPAPPIQNIVVSVRQASNAGAGDRVSNPTLLLSAHYDSVPSGPGATDDGAGVAIVLETLRNVVNDDTVDLSAWDLLVVLFDAEEVGTAGSQRFLATAASTWIDFSRDNVLMNLEGSGTAGKLTVVRGTSAWALRLFGDAAPRPYGFSLTQFIYNNLFLAGYTDLDTFLASHSMHAVELIAVDQRFRYHTRSDEFDYIQPGAIQHAGDNVLAFVRQVVKTDPNKVPHVPPVLAKSRYRTVTLEEFQYQTLYGVTMAVQSFMVQVVMTAVTATIVILSVLFVARRDLRACLSAGLRELGTIFVKIVVCLLVTAAVSAAVVGVASGADWQTDRGIRASFILVTCTLVWFALEMYIHRHRPREALIQPFDRSARLSLVAYELRPVDVAQQRQASPARPPTSPVFHVEESDRTDLIAVALFELLLIAILSFTVADLVLLAQVAGICVACALLVDDVYERKIRRDLGDRAPVYSWVYFFIRHVILLVPLLFSIELIVFMGPKLPFYLDAMRITWASSIVFSFTITLFVLPVLDPLFRTLKHNHLVVIALIGAAFCAFTVAAIAFRTTH
ncbi:Peptidase M28 domain-containing protein [Plasmodiophora brassicae]|uniref:Peptidase M28 domain-containing protein n=1 Tax=Plasmodiophora brassicae TaxID=37360 RepID=A0A0G4IMU2_PLABS|nr:hypothetical protein PBRA_005160 [Plasmodiophora brassicae]SPQ94608.1 unnamed protein product [Plasmodiophora brassicae]